MWYLYKSIFSNIKIGPYRPKSKKNRNLQKNTTSSKFINLQIFKPPKPLKKIKKKIKIPSSHPIDRFLRIRQPPMFIQGVYVLHCRFGKPSSSPGAVCLSSLGSVDFRTLVNKSPARGPPLDWPCFVCVFGPCVC